MYMVAIALAVGNWARRGEKLVALLCLRQAGHGRMTVLVEYLFAREGWMRVVCKTGRGCAKRKATSLKAQLPIASQ